MARPTINPKRGRVVRRPSRAAARKARERQERAFIVPVRRLESKQDAWIRQWVRKRWREDPNTILAKLTKLKIPFQQAITNALYQSRIASYRGGRAEGKAIVDAAIKRALPPRKRQIVATVEELEAKPDPFANVAAEYGAWAQTLGDERWQRKIKSVRGTLQSGIEQGWGLQEAYHWEDPDGGRVSAFEATAGRGGPQENGRKGYTRVTDNPGVMPALGEKLDDHKGYELERVARTENTRAFSGGKLDSFKANPSVTGASYQAIIDSRVTDLCESLDGQVMSIDDPRLKRWIPPRHVSCRSDIVPVFVFDDNPAPTVDQETTIKLQDPRTKEDYDFTYTPSRLKFMEDDSGDLSKIGFGRKNLMTVADAERARAGFVAPTKAEIVGQWLHPRSPAKAAATGAKVIAATTKDQAIAQLAALGVEATKALSLAELNALLVEAS